MSIINDSSGSDNSLLKSTNQRKIFRKQKRLQHLLAADIGIKLTDSPEKSIAVCNAGLSTGLKEHDLLSTCMNYGDVEQIIMMLGKSYCFVVFCDMKSAVNAYTNMHGATNLAQDNRPLYLSYIPSVPLTNSANSDIIPDGLSLFENFIDEAEERTLLAYFNFEDTSPDANMKHRRVKHFGYEFIYGKNNIDLNNPLQRGVPDCCDFLWNRLKSHWPMFENPPNQLTVNQYDPGQGIPSHVDTHSAFLSPILSLSLGSPVVMEFKLGDKRHNKILTSRSLLMMDSAARYEWTHGIAPRAYDLIDGRAVLRSRRTSLTFRWVRPDAICSCDFPQQCDTFMNKVAEKTFKMEELAPIIEQQHVHQVYAKIASHFSETRSKIWPSVSNFVESLSAGSFLVDIGCGNGKNLRLRSDIMQMGIEYTAALAELAKYGGDENKMSVEVTQADCLKLPLLSNCADAIISIAVYHHLVTEERRRQAICEAIRILKPNGQALISVWARDQARGDSKTSYLKQSRKNRKPDGQNFDSDMANNESFEVEEIKDDNGVSLDISLPVHVNRTKFLHQDLLVPWKLKNLDIKDDDGMLSEKSPKEHTFMRFYHVFEEGELDSLCRTVPGAIVLNSFYEQGNWCVILKKSIQ